MKFLILSNDPNSLINFRLDLLLKIKDLGYEVHAAAPGLVKSPIFYKLQEYGICCHSYYLDRISINPLSELRACLSLFKLINKIHPDHVLGYTIKPAIYGSIISKIIKIKYSHMLICGLGYMFSTVSATKTQGLKWKILLKLYKYSIKNTDTVFFQNNDDMFLFKNLSLVDNSSKVVVVNGSGVNISKFELVSLNFNSLLKPIPSFIMVGRLLEDKGVREYVNAAKFLKEKYPIASFNLVGGLDDNPASISNEELQEWISAGAINYLGKLADVRPALAESNIFVLPSYREGIPRSTLEAMAMGRAVITTNAPGCKETVKEGKNGFKVKVQSVEELICAMEKIILSPELIISMGEYSRQIILEKFDVNKVNKHMIDEMKL